MTKLPRRYAPFIYGVIQSGITTSIATLIASLQTMGFDRDAVLPWLFSWGVAWTTMLPLVILIAPLIQRAVLRMTTN